MGHELHQMLAVTTDAPGHDHSGHGDHSGHEDHGDHAGHGNMTMHHMMSMVVRIQGYFQLLQWQNEIKKEAWNTILMFPICDNQPLTLYFSFLVSLWLQRDHSHRPVEHRLTSRPNIFNGSNHFHGRPLWGSQILPWIPVLEDIQQSAVPCRYTAWEGTSGRCIRRKYTCAVSSILTLKVNTFHFEKKKEIFSLQKINRFILYQIFPSICPLRIYCLSKQNKFHKHIKLKKTITVWSARLFTSNRKFSIIHTYRISYAAQYNACLNKKTLNYVNWNGIFLIYHFNGFIFFFFLFLKKKTRIATFTKSI